MTMIAAISANAEMMEFIAKISCCFCVVNNASAVCLPKNARAKYLSRSFVVSAIMSSCKERIVCTVAIDFTVPSAAKRNITYLEKNACCNAKER